MHRVILGLGPNDKRRVDHIDRDPLNNQRKNLRICTQAQNTQNVRSRPKTSQFRGVCFRRGSWYAQACLERRVYHIGCFKTEEKAAEAARLWRAANMPFAVD